LVNVVVHHLETSRSHRVLWLLEELGVEYEMKIHRRDPKTIRAPAALREIHPLGKAPVVVIDGDVYAESGAIIEQCVEMLGDGKLRPVAGTPAAWQYRYWMHYAEGSLMAPLLVRLIIDKVRTAPLPFFIKPIARGVAAKVDATFTNPELALHMKFLEGHLGEHEYFAGDEFSGADVQMSYPVEAALARGRVDFETPHLDAWLKRVRERPAYQRALERGGPVMLP
jgi:glutathione S-transferase